MYIVQYKISAYYFLNNFYLDILLFLLRLRIYIEFIYIYLLYYSNNLINNLLSIIIFSILLFKQCLPIAYTKNDPQYSYLI